MNLFRSEPWCSRGCGQKQEEQPSLKPRWLGGTDARRRGLLELAEIPLGFDAPRSPGHSTAASVTPEGLGSQGRLSGQPGADPGAQGTDGSEQQQLRLRWGVVFHDTVERSLALGHTGSVRGRRHVGQPLQGPPCERENGRGRGEKPGRAIYAIFVILIFTPGLGEPMCYGGLNPQAEGTFFLPWLQARIETLITLGCKG